VIFFGEKFQRPHAQKGRKNVTLDHRMFKMLVHSHTTHFRPQLQTVPKGFHFMFDSWVFWLFNFFSCQKNCNINKPYYNFILILPMTVRSPTGNYMLFHLMITHYNTNILFVMKKNAHNFISFRLTTFSLTHSKVGL
jgi:hypothetical protein